ncbi:MAG: hypothetical protein GXO71_06645 [Caldiserica bacterium]|nr:hypothetical protein [Caldisericota bacterium]
MKEFLTRLLLFFTGVILLLITGKFFILGIRSIGTALALFYFLAFLIFLVFSAILIAPPFADWIARKFAHSLYFPDIGRVEERLYSVPRSLALKGEFEEAVKEYQKLLENDPEDRTARMEMADILAGKLKRKREAIQELEFLYQTAEEAKEKLFFLNRTVDLLIDEGEIKRAEELLKTALSEWKGREEETFLKERLGRVGEKAG